MSSNDAQKFEQQRFFNQLYKHGPKNMLNIAVHNPNITPNSFRQVLMLYSNNPNDFFELSKKTTVAKGKPAIYSKVVRILTERADKRGGMHTLAGLIGGLSSYIFGTQGTYVLRDKGAIRDSIQRPNWIGSDSRGWYNSTVKNVARLGLTENDVKRRLSVLTKSTKKFNANATSSRWKSKIPEGRILQNTNIPKYHKYRECIEQTITKRTNNTETTWKFEPKTETVVHWNIVLAILLSVVFFVGVSFWFSKKGRVATVKNKIDASVVEEYQDTFAASNHHLHHLHPVFKNGLTLSTLRYSLIVMKHRVFPECNICHFVREDGSLRTSFDEIARAIEYYPTTMVQKTLYSAKRMVNFVLRRKSSTKKNQRRLSAARHT